jgi:hypothetical protein
MNQAPAVQKVAIVAVTVLMDSVTVFLASLDGIVDRVSVRHCAKAMASTLEENASATLVGKAVSVNCPRPSVRILPVDKMENVSKDGVFVHPASRDQIVRKNCATWTVLMVVVKDKDVYVSRVGLDRHVTRSNVIHAVLLTGSVTTEHVHARPAGMDDTALSMVVQMLVITTAAASFSIVHGNAVVEMVGRASAVRLPWS